MKRRPRPRCHDGYHPNRSRTEKRARRCLSAGHCQGTIRKDNSCRPVRRTMVSRSSPAPPSSAMLRHSPSQPPGQTGRKTATSPCRRHSRPPENTPKRQPQAGVRKWSVPKAPPQVSLRAQYTLFPRADWINSEARMPLLLAVSRKGLDLHHVHGDQLPALRNGLCRQKGFTGGQAVVNNHSRARAQPPEWMASTSKLRWMPSVPSPAIWMARSITAPIPSLSIMLIGNTVTPACAHTLPLQIVNVPVRRPARSEPR